MRKFFLIPFLTLLLACGSASEPTVQPVKADEVLTAPDGFAVACMTNYTRVQPHFCMFTGTTLSPQTLTLDTTCRPIDISAFVPTSTRLALLNIDVILASSNIVGQQAVAIAFDGNNTCTIFSGNIEFNAREFVAVVAGTTIYRFQQRTLAIVALQNLNYIGNKTGSTSHTVNVSVIGYYD